MSFHPGSSLSTRSLLIRHEEVSSPTYEFVHHLVLSTSMVYEWDGMLQSPSEVATRVSFSWGCIWSHHTHLWTRASILAWSRLPEPIFSHFSECTLCIKNALKTKVVCDKAEVAWIPKNGWDNSLGVPLPFKNLANFSSARNFSSYSGNSVITVWVPILFGFEWEELPW